MKKLIILLILTLNLSYSVAQLFYTDPAGENYFIRGNQALKSGNYPLADSLYTLSLNTYRSEDVFFNRAIARLMMKDTLHCCDDFKVAANYFYDEQAQTSFNLMCCMEVDTCYYDKKMNPVDKGNHRYYEIIKKLKYENEVLGTIHDVEESHPQMTLDFAEKNSLTGIFNNQTDLIASYKIINGEKYYNKILKPVYVKNSREYEAVKRKLVVEMNKKYENLKKENDIDELILAFRVFYNENGEFEKFEYQTCFPDISDKPDSELLEEEISELAGRYPDIRPVKFFKEKVKLIVDDNIRF